MDVDEKDQIMMTNVWLNLVIFSLEARLAYNTDSRELVVWLPEENKLLFDKLNIYCGQKMSLSTIP